MGVMTTPAIIFFLVMIVLMKTTGCALAQKDQKGTKRDMPQTGTSIKHDDDRQVGLVVAILHRIWLSEYLGKPSDHPNYGDRCTGIAKKLLEPDSPGHIRFENSTIPEIAQHELMVWPYTCSPVQLTGSPFNDMMRPTQLTITALNFDQIERVRRGMVRVLTDGDLGKYSIDETRFSEIEKTYARLLPGFSLNGKSNYVTYPRLDRGQKREPERWRRLSFAMAVTPPVPNNTGGVNFSILLGVGFFRP